MTQNRSDRVPIQIDMTPDGRFTAPPASPAGGPISGKIMRLALLVAGLATAGALAALAFWLALTLIPIAIGAGLVAYGVIRYRMWKAGISFRRPGGPVRRA
jgi:hypothetical protein